MGTTLFRRSFPAVLLAALLVVAAACGSSSSGASGTTSSSKAPDTTTTASPGGGSTSGLAVPTGNSGSGSGGGSATVKVATLPGFGQVLVSAKGRTLYLYTPDKGTQSACTGGCLQAWPPISAASPVAGKGVEQKLLSTANAAAKNQLVYNGHLLYFYVADVQPGQDTGASIPEWYPVSPSGQLVKKH
jgi:predicted lipoprotein with Yx(FWY)xxD motif